MRSLKTSSRRRTRHWRYVTNRITPSASVNAPWTSRMNWVWRRESVVNWTTASWRPLNTRPHCLFDVRLWRTPTGVELNQFNSVYSTRHHPIQCFSGLRAHRQSITRLFITQIAVIYRLHYAQCIGRCTLQALKQKLIEFPPHSDEIVLFLRNGLRKCYAAMKINTRMVNAVGSSTSDEYGATYQCVIQYTRVEPYTRVSGLRLQLGTR